MSDPILSTTFTLQPPPARSHLRLIAGSDAVVIQHPSPCPGFIRRALVRWLLGMEWRPAPHK